MIELGHLPNLVAIAVERTDHRREVKLST